jgi:hypothetical protein
VKDNHNLTGREVSRHVRLELLKFGVVSAAGPEMSRARELAALLIGAAIVSTEALDRVQATTECAVFIAHEDGQLTGVLAFILLNAQGADAVLRGAFDAADPVLEHLASPDEIVCAVYGWGICATAKPTARRLVEGSEAIKPLLDHVAHYARPTTEAGRRLMCERLGFVDLPGSQGLVWLPAAEQHKPAVAA